ncbi:hypothetical protein [Candidatus Nitrospira nitrificans]|uniref:DUF5666 domain-containing protein n=1 Tax=Candidatus Nitrospira nitrificans TaxID=1742973 RepID=A0A0S4LKK7_9BACT|nr:hypothetical protein [Candidatus Nitrospira nitrificans]CUS37465.1 exported hypothetical protein [Candidatus Nitrospira nitrificans]
MSLQTKALGGVVLTVLISLGLSTNAFSSADRTVYDKPDVQPGKIIKGKVMRIDEQSAQSWNVSVKDQETGETVVIHIDKTTTRKDIMLPPSLGDNVIAKYHRQNNHATSFLTDQTMNR